MIAFLLWLLATIDSAFIGYREAAGRNALIDKRAYYRRALLRGALFGQLAVVTVGLVTGILLWTSADHRLLFRDLEIVGARMLTIYIPFALIILTTFLFRAIPSVDIKSITSVVIFGPLTLLRPIVVLVGAVWGVKGAPGIVTITLTALIVCFMLGLESIMVRLRSAGFFK
jgi:hypothetical protein